MTDLTASPPPSGPLAELAAFLTQRPPPPAEINVVHAIRRAPVTPGRVAGAVLGEIADTIIDGADVSDGPAPRLVQVRWTVMGREVARFEADCRYTDAVRECVIAARPLGIPVLCGYEVNRVAGTDLFARYFASAPLPDPGPLWRIVGVEDTSHRFDAMIGEVDRPGRIGRTLLRRNTVEESFRVTLDSDALRIVTIARKNVGDVAVPVDELIAVHRSYGPRRRYTAITSTGVVELPNHDHIAARGATEMTDWIFARVNQRLGV